MASNFNQAAVVLLFQQVRSTVSKLGIVDNILGHEPKSAPGGTKTCAFWLGPVVPIPALSGLNTVTGRVVINARLYFPFLGQAGQSQGDIGETALMHAIFEMLAAFTGSFTLGGEVMEVDLLGAHGVALESGTVGYLEQDGTHYRAAEMTIPVIIDSLWTEVN